jgi:hypothetical protein
MVLARAWTSRLRGALWSPRARLPLNLRRAPNRGCLTLGGHGCFFIALDGTATTGRASLVARGQHFGEAQLPPCRGGLVLPDGSRTG